MSDHRRHARHAHQPRRTRGALVMAPSPRTCRSATSSRDLRPRAGAPGERPEPGLRRQRRIEKPSDDPLGARARPCASTTSSNRPGRTARRSDEVAQLARRHRQRAELAQRGRPARARAHATGGQRLDLRRRAPVDQGPDRSGSPKEAKKNTLTAPTTGAHIFSGTATDTAPLLRRHRRTPNQGDCLPRGAPDRPRRERPGQRDRRPTCSPACCPPCARCRPTWRPTTPRRWAPATCRRSTPASTTWTAKRGPGRRP